MFLKDKYDQGVEWVKRRSHTYNIHLTCLLLIIAAVLVFIALRGKPEHKALATIYIML